MVDNEDAQNPSMLIDFPHEHDRFKNHLSFEKNQRVFFSGKFGTGKTFFLENFFKNENQYQVIKLNPVKYSVASNDDIFELIKYDILFELLSTDLEYKKPEIPWDLSLYFFSMNNSWEILNVVSGILKIGKKAFEIAEPLNRIFNSFNDYHKKNNKSHEDLIKDYLKSMTLKKGINEEDPITEVITQSINNIKNEEKEVILLIDDLDRLDPEHIFRILNVFAAHFDTIPNQNKFDLDKIILVADINNIRNIYTYKYGPGVDFNGYMDKFISTDIFELNNLNYIESSVETFLDQVIVMKDKIVQEIRYAPFAFDDKEFNSIFDICNKILGLMVKTKCLSIRRLQTMNGLIYKIKSYPIGNSGVMSEEIYIVQIFDFIASVLGDEQTLENSLKICASSFDLKKKKRWNEFSEICLSYLLPILTYRDLKFQAQTHTWKDSKSGITIDIEPGRYKGKFSCKPNTTDYSIFELLYSTYLELKHIKEH